MTNDRFYKSILFVICHLFLFLYICDGKQSTPMEILFEDNALEELYKEGKTKDKKYKTLQKDIIKRFVKTVDILSAVDKIETLFLFNSLHYEKLIGDKKGLESVRVNDKYRLEFFTSIETMEGEDPPETITICSIVALSNHYS